MRVYQRGKRGTWWVDITVDGERVKRSAGTQDRRQAEEYAATLARDLWRSKRLGDAPRVTWDAAVIAWLQEHQHRKSIEEIKRVLRWLSDRLAGKALADITDPVVRLLASERKAQKVGEQPTSNATVNRHMAQLSAVLHYAHRRGWLTAVPPIAKMHEPAKRVAWITKEQARALLGELPAHLKPIAGFALATGLRESNVRMLCWSQVDMRRRVAWVYADQAKAGKDLHVPLNDAAMLVLEAQAGKHSRWVFPVPRLDTKTAEAPTGKVSNHAWRKACVRAGVPTLRFHDLRHTWATWHVQAGTPLAVLQELGGWASLAMVQRYAHMARSHVAQWADNLLRGTTAVQLPSDESAEAPDSLGWLMGLEPTTTRITIRSRAARPGNIKHLQVSKRRKAA